MNFRRQTRSLQLGKVAIGGGAPVSIQSMTNTDTRDAAATLRQIRELAKLGCQIIRVAVPDTAAAAALPEIVEQSPLPVIADIHFDYRLALAALRAGVGGIRINPGNLKSESQLRQVAELALERGAVIRVGSNSGSLRPELVRELRAGGMTPEEAQAEALCLSVERQCALLERYGFRNLKVSLKASSVPVTVAAYRRYASRSEYPLHIGVTEAGTPARGVVKSAVGIGTLLLEGIGETIRVSLTADPAEEVVTALRILESCGLRQAAPELVSCPTCGRTEVNLIGLANRVEALLNELKAEGHTIGLRKVAVMGCAVNGPGEARDADLGLAGAKGKVVLFRFGEILGAYDEEPGFAALRAEILKSCR